MGSEIVTKQRIEPANRRAKRLSAAYVKSAPPGKHYDEHGLFLLVKPSGAKHWLQRIQYNGKRRELGLGSWPWVTLAEAREQAFENKRMVKRGGDPLAAKGKPSVPTFEEASAKVIAIYAETWKDSGRTAAIWESRLRRYAFPRLGRKRVDKIETRDVMACLLPIWGEKRDTAKRVRQIISAVMKWAVAQGYRESNPAGDAIGAALPKASGPVKHRRALPHAAVADALETVRTSGAGIATKLAIEFLTLTATRSSETRLARWDEVDTEEAIWRVPAERAKTKRTHEVPLSTRALELLTEAREIADDSGLLFPSPRGRPLSDATLSKLIRELGINAVPHEFRSSFRSWCADSGIDREAAEACLAHVVGGVEGAYQRSTMFERRRKVMEGWARYLGADASESVIPMVRPRG